jgi:hypothetical protein
MRPRKEPPDAFWEPGYMAAAARQNEHPVARRQDVCVLELAGLLAGSPHMPMSEPLDLASFGHSVATV